MIEISREGKRGCSLPRTEASEAELRRLIPENHRRRTPPRLPQLSEPEVVRHYTLLSRKNLGVDLNFYPLGSCTMKYNPKINEKMAALAGFNEIHPYQPESAAQGLLELLYRMQCSLAGIAGMETVTLQPAAGAHGEFTGMLMIRAYFAEKKEKRTKVLIPDSAHGTNPASCHYAGFQAVEIKSNAKGMIDLEELDRNLDDGVACVMITNPNTLGLFEENIAEVARRVHARGALLYMDGANLNAFMGIARPGDFGVDVLHFNLHKSFSTPHGGGGPGSGPVGVKKHLEPYLPVPVVSRSPEGFFLDYRRPRSIGKVRSFYGNVGVIIKAYCYLRMLGGEGLAEASRDAVLNANYLLARLKDVYEIPYPKGCLHEFVISLRGLKQKGLKAVDVAKRIIDFDMHPPTVCFPLIVPEALMVEPTETESKETLDRFVEVMKRIAAEAENEPDILRNAPASTPVSRLDEVKAAREPVTGWNGGEA